MAYLKALEDGQEDKVKGRMLAYLKVSEMSLTAFIAEQPEGTNTVVARSILTGLTQFLDERIPEKERTVAKALVERVKEGAENRKSGPSKDDGHNQAFEATP